MVKLSAAANMTQALRERGPTAFGAQAGFVTIHPSYLLRLPDERSKAREYEKFVADFVHVRRLLAQVHVAA
jgi:uracil-DNA glycosylase